MSLEEGKILSSDVNDLISRINTEINRRTVAGFLKSNAVSNGFQSTLGGTDNEITSSHNSKIHPSWLCVNRQYRKNFTIYSVYYLDESNNKIICNKNQSYNENTQFIGRYLDSDGYWAGQENVSAEQLQSYGCLKPTYTIDTPSISSGTKATAEDINTLIELLNVINTDTYWDTATAVTAGNLIQTIIEISNTLEKFENAPSEKSISRITQDKVSNIGSPPGNTSGCGSACKGLCQSCLGSAIGSSSGDGCDYSGCDYSGCDSCSSGCQGGCGGCGYTCSSSSD